LTLRPALLATAALIAVLGAPQGVTAQQVPLGEAAPPRASPPASSPPGETQPSMRPGDAIDVAADTLTYDDNSAIITASGDVNLAREAWKLRADRVEYDRGSGLVLATGNVVSIDPEGNQAFGDSVRLDESLNDGTIDNLLLVLNDGGRLAANSGVRSGNIIRLDHALYSPCAVVDNEGCPHAPVWQVKGKQVTYNRDKHRISYRDASLEMFGVPILYLPRFSHPDALAKQVTGLLLPGIEFRRQLGFGVSLPYHIALAPDRDITITPHFYTSESPALQLQARRLFSDGPVEIDAFFTYAQRIDFAADNITQINEGRRFRGYFGIKGQFQHSPQWRSTFSLRLTTDDTFNRLYGLDLDDTLRSTYALERRTATSYLSISGWAFQGLRVSDRSGEIPFALPLIDYDWRPAEVVLGGRLRIGANILNLVRTGGQSIQRGLAFGRWDRSVVNSVGLRVTGTAMLRTDLYNVIDPQRATLPEYAGERGIQGRVVPLAGLDFEWPFTGPALGGNQTITPRFQIVGAPASLNGSIPNEDSRAIELEDISLFDLNRFPGFDRVESGSRITYGVEYALDRPGWALRSQVGQSLRIAGRGNDFPAGTGLSDTVSDFTGRTNLKIGSFVEITHRFRLDRETLAVRRNEIDLALGTRRSYLTVNYLKLNRNIMLEDLEDRTELRVGGRIAFARFWSAFGSGIIDLTRKAENPNATGDGFGPIRHRVGIEYEDECFRIGVSWRRDYVSDRDFRAGNAYLITLAFKTLGR
jgi:LPS-assembly protein